MKAVNKNHALKKPMSLFLLVVLDHLWELILVCERELKLHKMPTKEET